VTRDERVAQLEHPLAIGMRVAEKHVTAATNADLNHDDPQSTHPGIRSGAPISATADFSPDNSARADRESLDAIWPARGSVPLIRAITTGASRPTRPRSSGGMSAISETRPSLTPPLTVVAADAVPWYATAPTSPDERRRELVLKRCQRAALDRYMTAAWRAFRRKRGGSVRVSLALSVASRA